MNELKIFIATLLILLLSLFQLAFNGEKCRRIRQFPLVLVSFILMAVGVYVWYNNFDKAGELCGLTDFLTNADMLVANAALLGFAFIRLPLRPLIAAIFKDNKTLAAFSLDIYAYDEEYGEWFLKKRWVNFRQFFLTVSIALNVATGSYLGVTWILGEGSCSWLMIFPGAAVVVVNEIYNFINGQTKEEYAYSILGDDADARRVSNYYKLREILEQILPEPLLSAHTGCEFVGANSPAELLGELRDSGNEKDLTTADYFYGCGRYKIADVDCVQATAQIMQRRNVLFYNPFYRDLSMYITLPLVTALLSGKKCVVLCGRRSVTEDVRNWLSELLIKYSHMKTLWRVNILSDKEPDCEVGVITFSQIYDKRVININREFLGETDFVLLIEPSVMLNTSQTALSIISGEMERDGVAPVYCVCDRNTDGLVDTLSHLLHAEITDVVAAPVPRCSYTAMSWNADGDFCRQQLFDKQTKYLGNGIELAAIAVKNQIPKVTWYSETKAPIKDIKWIAGQYYSTVCRYMNQPAQQKALYEKIDFLSNLWSSERSAEGFVIAEDEFCNMFTMMRAYLSRGTSQTFVNIMSENYLLRDYMRCNRQMFMSDPNAIPSLVPDYAKTERNTILKLIILMTLRPVTEEEILKELHLVGIETTDAFGVMAKLLHKYTFADNTVFTVRGVRIAVDEFTSVSSCVFSISDEAFDSFFADSLKNAYYILEDEKDNEGYIDAKLFSHVTQTVLPGQLVTYDGKYYSVKYISPQSGVVLRRASDVYNGRKYYRQVRKYSFDGEACEVVSSRTIGDVEFTELRTDFHVDTTGYLEMSDSHNLRTAKLIDLSNDPTVSNYSRKYHNKSLLRIKLPDSDDKIRFTLCMLLSEMFRSVFPDGWQYLAVVTKRPDDIEGMLNYMVYPIEGSFDDEYVYVIEDSDIDLGLTTAVEKNFTRLMEIVSDFLEWHFEKMREPACKDPVPAKVAAIEAETKKKRGLIVRMLDRIRKLFGIKKKREELKLDDADKPASGKQGQEDEHSEKESKGDQKESGEYSLGSEEKIGGESRTPELEADDAGAAGDYTLGTEKGPDGDAIEAEEVKAEEPEAEKAEPAEAKAPVPARSTTAEDRHSEEDYMPSDSEDPDLVAIDGTDIFDNDGMPEDNDYFEESFKEMGLIPLTMSRYQKECFLKFGFEEIDDRIRVDDTRKYLRVRGWSNNYLTQARKKDVIAKTLLDLDAVNHCDFCGLPLSGVSYERLNDGRIRCNDCSGSAISRLEDFKELFYRTLDMMSDFYGISYHVPISVKTADARTVAKGAGMIFRPSTDIAPRVLGFARRKSGKYSLLIENGSPRLATTDTMVHEMTHIWQYLNWSDSQIEDIYSMNEDSCTAAALDVVYEGMSMWASVQYLYQIGESYYAARQDAVTSARSDIYGIGYRLYKEQYPLVTDSSLLKYSPFASFPPLEPAAVKGAVKARCGNGRCTC